MSRFKIVGNYIYPPLVSTQTFVTADIARSENKKWVRQAIDQGLIWKGRVVRVADAEGSRTSSSRRTRTTGSEATAAAQRVPTEEGGRA